MPSHPLKKPRIQSKQEGLAKSQDKKTWMDYRIIIAVLFFVFSFLLYKNISYPLLWNDESETVVHAQQILKYGYPKMHDEKNCVFLPDEPTWIGYKPSADANITMPWGQYYFATIGVSIAEHISDIYLKGGVIRMTFATMGLLGLFIFLFALRDLFSDRSRYYKFIAAFIFIELFSVSLFVHLREARYYALVVFVVSCFFYVFISNFILLKFSRKKYLLLMTLVLFFVYQVNVVTFLSCSLTLFSFEAVFRVMDMVRLVKKEGWKYSELWFQIRIGFLNLAPVLMCGVMLIPFLNFFETFSVARRAAEHYHYTASLYYDHLKRIYYVLSTQEFLYLALFLKGIQLIVWYRKTNEKNSKNKNEVSSVNLEKTSLFITLFAICFTIMISRTPYPLMWTRYIIVLQPVIVLVLLLDFLIIFNYLSGSTVLRPNSFLRLSFIILFVIGFIWNVQGKRIDYMKDYFYQLTHQYKGPLDYLIPYIKDNYKNPENIVIATNYEELSYIYYLHSKVILGYINKNYEEDMKLQPDVIIFRKTWGHNPAPYNELIQRGKYKRVSFPVFDSNVNNIAELDFGIQHQFRTRLPANESEKSDILVRVNE